MNWKDIKYQITEPCDHTGVTENDKWNWGFKLYMLLRGKADCECCVGMRHLALGFVLGFFVAWVF